MNIQEKFGLFVLGNPILSNDHNLWLNDCCYAETLTLVGQIVPISRIVARTRNFDHYFGRHVLLSQVGADLALALPDYGIGGWRCLRNALLILFSPAIRRTMRVLVERAEFIYVEGLSLEAFLTAQVARQVGQKLIMEIRTIALLNQDYMHHRFGFLGSLLSLLYKQMFAYVRRQSCAGFYANHSLMERYPVAGKQMKVISNANLPEDFGDSPRSYAKFARRYLYIGHLEKNKRVDLILNSLYLAREYLPAGWHFDIVGAGPLEGVLRALVVRLELGDCVTFHGRVQWGKLIKKFYEQADMLFIASTSETGPRVAVEAMAFGLPVLSTRIGLPLELLDQDALVSVGDLASYSKRIVKLANNPARLTKLSKLNWHLAQNFRQSILEVKRRKFWKQAIELSHRDCNK